MNCTYNRCGFIKKTKDRYKIRHLAQVYNLKQREPNEQWIDEYSPYLHIICTTDIMCRLPADAASLKTSLFPFHVNRKRMRPCEKCSLSYIDIYRGFSLENVAYNKAVWAVFVSSIISSHFIRHSDQQACCPQTERRAWIAFEIQKYLHNT